MPPANEVQRKRHELISPWGLLLSAPRVQLSDREQLAAKLMKPVE
jgi:hypothetical protein